MIDWREHLTSDPKVCGGQLCAKGTRVLVTVILDNLAEGLGREEILRSYPTLEPIHIDAALAYAAELAREESTLPLRPARGSSSTRTSRSNCWTTFERRAMTPTDSATRV